METMEDMESELGQLDCLDVPEDMRQLVLPGVVLREILKNLSSADCLNLSCVNKVWHYEAQSVLRNRGSFTAKMNTGDGRCKDLRAFASDLRRMREVRKVVPFTGLTIAVSGQLRYHDCGRWLEELLPGELDQIYEDIVHQMEWKHLKIKYYNYWEQNEDCTGFQLAKKILLNRSRDLEEFSLEFGSDLDREAFNQHFLDYCNFSCLETLTFRGQQSYGRDDENLIKALVSRAPNLKLLCTKSRVNLTVNLLEGRSAAVHDYDNNINFNLEDIPESIVSQLRLRALILHTGPKVFTLERFDRMVPVLLQISRTTLRYINIDAVLLVALIHYGICLENVVELVVVFNEFDTSDPRSRQLLKSSDLTRVFPNLRSFEVFSFMGGVPNHERTWNAVNDMVEQGNAALMDAAHPSVNIKQFDLICFSGIRDGSTRFLVEMFPHIEKIAIEVRSAPCVRLWDYWLNLEELDIAHLVLPSQDVLEYLDSVFCGIFPEEVAHLQEQNEEYLETVNIVPVMPALSSLKSLKTLKVFFDVGRRSVVRSTCTLSKVTGLIAFKRRPHLTVTLETNNFTWRQALEQMKPYAFVQMTGRSLIDC